MRMNRYETPTTTAFTIYATRPFAIADGQSLFMVAKLLVHKDDADDRTLCASRGRPDTRRREQDRRPYRRCDARERVASNPVVPTSPQTGPKPNGTEAA